LQHIDFDLNYGVRPEEYERTPNPEDYGDMDTLQRNPENYGNMNNDKTKSSKWPGTDKAAMAADVDEANSPK
jgi:hypothetical protein